MQFRKTSLRLAGELKNRAEKSKSKKVQSFLYRGIEAIRPKGRKTPKGAAFVPLHQLSHEAQNSFKTITEKFGKIFAASEIGLGCLLLSGSFLIVLKSPSAAMLAVPSGTFITYKGLDAIKGKIPANIKKEMLFLRNYLMKTENPRIKKIKNMQAGNNPKYNYFLIDPKNKGIVFTSLPPKIGHFGNIHKRQIIVIDPKTNEIKYRGKERRTGERRMQKPSDRRTEKDRRLGNGKTIFD